jgi:hypothetical protein
VGLSAPATLVVGEVVRLRQQLSWFDTLGRESFHNPLQFREKEGREGLSSRTLHPTL